jgi:uncharacterized RDD family membrane protein YckC
MRPVTAPPPPAGWYPDPTIPGAQRYFDGMTWTHHLVPPPPASWHGLGQQPWKGAVYGLPATGPGALANPGRRLGARALDALVLLPVLLVFCAIGISLVAPHAGPIFPRVPATTRARQPTPGFVWIYLTVIGCLVLTGLTMVLYETVATAKWGRTLGKAWLHIRPVRLDGTVLGWARSFGRVALYWLSGWLSWIGLLDPLWCLWDANQQCLHDKVVGTLVVNDPIAAEPSAQIS